MAILEQILRTLSRTTCEYSVRPDDRCYRIVSDNDTPLQRITCRKWCARKSVLQRTVLIADAEGVFWTRHLPQRMFHVVEASGDFFVESRWIRAERRVRAWA